MENLKANLTETLAAIFLAGVRQVDPEHMILSQAKREGNVLEFTLPDRSLRLDLSAYSRILILGAGKASARMAKAMETLLGDKISRGVVAVKYGHTEALKKIELIESGHPVPDENSLKAARALAALAEEADKDCLVFNLISGGGSALLCCPYEGPEASLTLEEKQKTTALLLECGADIREINAVRKHLSGIKGGRLAGKIYPARCVNLILSDVVGDDLDSIASGLTVPDKTSFSQVAGVMEKYALWDRLPENVRFLLEQGLAGKVPETPKPGDPVFAGMDNLLIGTNRAALQAAEAEARRRGYNTLVLSSRVTGEAREIAKFYAALAQETLLGSRSIGVPACILAGGETTVTLRGTGKGGRNQEMALAFLREMERYGGAWTNCAFLSGGTDGNDGPTDAAGAFAWEGALAKAREKGLEPASFLAENDSYHFFEAVGGLLFTGPTNTNVCDIQIILCNGPSQ